MNKNKMMQAKINSKKNPVVRNPEPEVTIQSLSHDGRGIAKIDGKTIFIENALPGEKVTWIPISFHRRYTEGRAVEILEASPDRSKPPCPHFEQCGGCQLQHLSSEAQLTLKQNVLLEQLLHFGNIEVKPEILLPPLQGPTLGYRRKARLGVKFVTKKEKVLVGFREKRSGKLADIESCAVLFPKVGKIILPLQKMIRSLNAFQSIPQIEVAAGESETAFVFRNLESLCAEDKEKLRDFAKEHDISIFLQPGNPSTVYPLIRIIDGIVNDIMHDDAIEGKPKHTLDYHLKIPKNCGKNEIIVNNEDTSVNQSITLKFHPLDFIQVNAEMNQKMVSLALTLLDLKSNDTVLDLFCGLGNFTLSLALHAKHVVGVEGASEMIDLAKENAALNQISNVEFHTDNLQPDETINLSHKIWFKNYDKILIDPPRTGAETLMSLIPQMKPQRIVYVSCNPATLSRDIGILVNEYHYKLIHIGIMDMFPHTAHVESIAVLEPKY